MREHEVNFFLENCSNFHQQSLNVFKTMGYTNKYNLPDDSPTREILIRRHASIRRSLRAESFREMVGVFCVCVCRR